jgi:hypothetical protein
MRTHSLVFVIAVMGCADDTEQAVGQEDGSSGTGSSTTATPTTETTMPTTTPSTGAETTEAGGSSSSGQGDSADDTTTTPPGDCAFEPAIDAALETSTREPIDCGAVTLDDDVALWQDARDCARDSTLDQVSYKVLWQYDDAGTLRDAAFASEVGEVYAIYRFDDDAAEGTTSITRITCTGISTPNDCAVMPGEICIFCIEPSEPAELCD